MIDLIRWQNAVAGSGAEVEAVVADLRLEDQIQEIFRRSMLKWGRLDALVNCAAVGSHEPLRDGKTDSWRAMLEVNVRSCSNSRPGKFDISILLVVVISCRSEALLGTACLRGAGSMRQRSSPCGHLLRR